MRESASDLAIGGINSVMEEVNLFWIAGSLHGRFPLLAPPVRAAVDLALVDLAWKAFCERPELTAASQF